MPVHALAARTRGAELTPFVFDTPDLGANDVLIRVRACGICHSDVHMIDNDWGISAYPLVPGHEAVGEVVETGGAVTHLKPGARVGVGWQSGACLTCDDCLAGNENLCSSSKATIVGRHGGFADHLVVDGRFAFKLPDGLAYDTTGPLLCGGITVYSALRRAGMGSGGSIGVIGVGGLGHMAVKFAASLGNEVTAYTTSADKAEFAAQLGARNAVVVPSGDKPPKPARGHDILISTAPADLDWPAWINLLGSDGTLTFVGVPSKPLVLPVGALLGRRRRVMASPIGGRGMITDMLRIADRFGVAPIVETFAAADAAAAVQKVRDNTIRYRAVLRF